MCILQFHISVGVGQAKKVASFFNRYIYALINLLQHKQRDCFLLLRRRLTADFRLAGARLRALPRDAVLLLVGARFRGLLLIADFRTFERPVLRFRLPTLRDLVLRRRDVFRARVVLRERDVLRALDVFRLGAGVRTDDSRLIFLLRAGDFDADRLVFPCSDFKAIVSSIFCLRP